TIPNHVSHNDSSTLSLHDALPISAVVGTKEATNKIINGDQLIVDGMNGIVHINPSKQTIEQYEKKRQRIQATRFRLTTFKRRRRSEEHTSELQSRFELVCRLLLEK